MKLRLVNKPSKKQAQEFDYDVICDGAIIPVYIKTSKRKTISIQVHHDTKVIVRSPLKLPIRQIEEFVCEKKNWILTKQKELMENPKKTIEYSYTEGEIFLFLGQKLKLRIQQSLRNKITVDDGYLILNVTHPNNKTKIKKLVDDWYKAQAQEVFNSRLVNCVDIAKVIDVNYDGEITLRRMKSRWGSCSSNGEITLNIYLVCTPPECIDYVILHELCHLREHNHSSRFYALMDIVMPNWKAAKKLLNSSITLK